MEPVEGDGTRNRWQSLSGKDVQVEAEKLMLTLRDKLKYWQSSVM